MTTYQSNALLKSLGLDHSHGRKQAWELIIKNFRGECCGILTWSVHQREKKEEEKIRSVVNFVIFPNHIIWRQKNIFGSKVEKAWIKTTMKEENRHGKWRQTAQSVLGFWNDEEGDKHKGKRNKAVKFPFDAMGKGIETVSKEIMYSWHDHIKNVVVWVEEREV